MLQLFNTTTRVIEPFKPLRGKTARVYSCGPTVYDYAHIGNLRQYVFSDLLRRVLELNGYRVKQVINITDVGHLVADADIGEEKIELAARRAGKSAWEIARFFESAFVADLRKLKIKRPRVLPRATDHLKEQIALVKILEKKGYTYRTSDGIYFDTAKFPAYGKLSGQSLKEREAGRRVEVSPEKRNPWDFALWKFSPADRKREMEWPSPWGKGFPGWHIECSAMSRQYLGQPFDIHTGGIDHLHPHHTNEIAQSEAAYGRPLARFWMHGEFLLVDNQRMGKSEGNLITLAEIERQGFDPLAYRYFVLGAHYRSPLNFTWAALAAAQQALWNLQDMVRDWPRPWGRWWAFQKKFLAAVNNDLDTPAALAALWELVKSNSPLRKKAGTILWFDRVLGLGLESLVGQSLKIPKEVARLAHLREAAREQRDFSAADSLRQQIESRGFLVEDTAEGPKIREDHSITSINSKS
ncbi:cysteine--tRNA ligase [Candidatus Uhrbacteria bacterium]|nr:cysteine--tRNA ligase [Candidatus Uhrbacteria bacterium]